jgi:DNA-directed RNA polymerase beta subunit
LPIPAPTVPEAFKVLMRELNALGIEAVALDANIKEEPEAQVAATELIEESVQQTQLSEQDLVKEEVTEAKADAEDEPVILDADQDDNEFVMDEDEGKEKMQAAA